jgi:hypothetical protein
MTEQDWDFTVDLCLKSVFFGVKHAARHMTDAGSPGRDHQHRIAQLAGPRWSSGVRIQQPRPA